jgi:hypothetical protein
MHVQNLLLGTFVATVCRSVGISVIRLFELDTNPQSKCLLVSSLVNSQVQLPRI